ncbi:YdhK family protein [Bacillus sp. S13(2024)]|uniref:DUF1541 domain-containing protein n=1 Tax=unclassified Bacillus (in: firmicutes) TaxID=185979 RepID=UPI003D207F98
MKRITLLLISLVTAFSLAACSTATKENDQSSMGNMKHGTMSDMNHSSSDEIPKGLKEEKNSTYKVDSQVIVKADHMEGMNGTKATVVGAYDTTAYTVSYTPTTGGAKVTNHKWVIQEEIKNAGDETLKPGTEVTLEADHMKGMMGAKGTIDSAEKTTVYMIDYTPTTGGEKITNHKWVTENELSTK